MNQQKIITHLSALPSKRAFCIRHGLPPRTLWRLISGGANPTQSTLLAFAAALKAEHRRKPVQESV